MSKLSIWRFALLLLWLLTAPTSLAQNRPVWLADILADRPALADPEERAAVAREMRLIQEERKALAVERAAREGLPIRTVTADGAVAELMDFDGDTPLYAVTYNREAAISTAADVTRLQFGVDGAGSTMGIWDAGSVRLGHEAFTGRAFSRDGATIDNHATHVAGTMVASGPNTRAHGMAPAALIDSYDWNSDKAEMTARGASYAREPGKLKISNHSYGYRSGWDGNQWFGQGNDQNGVEENFGRYHNLSRDMDSLAFSLPYYLAFWAAGNDRSNNPATGSSVVIGGNTVTYNPAIHPPGDGIYKQGFDTIGYESLSKNVVTVGAVNDAVLSSLRNLDQATMTGFSSWGPTDDGRIKPDIVANGASVYSTTSGSNISYGTLSGTSMATPNASGSAQLLVSKYEKLFPNHAMRASTLKALIIHTSDDLGVPGPDYRFGWGLMNTAAAAAHIADHGISPGSHRLVEGLISTATPTRTYAFTWDGENPIRATLVWTDPAGAATTTHDFRTRRLVNDLDLSIIGPDGVTHLPFVMPYVGSWDPALLSAPATTGRNSTDNVEQVLIAAPGPGLYTARVTFSGTLQHNQQFHSLIISGSADTTAAPPAVAGHSISLSGELLIANVTGAGFQQGAQLTLVQPGFPPREAFSHAITATSIQARFDVAGLEGGNWSIRITNTDGQTDLIPGAYVVAVPIWAETFDGGSFSLAGAGWTSSAEVGSSSWNLSTNASRSPTRSVSASAPATRSLTNLVSPGIPVPADATSLTFSFWHRHFFQSGRDGGLLQFSSDNGTTWQDIGASGSGTSFLSGGYNTTLTGTGNPNTRNPLVGDRAWSGNRSAFSEVVVQLDPTRFAGRTMRARWRLGTDSSVGSDGWFIDDIQLRGAAPAPLAIPEIISPAEALENPVTENSVQLFVEARNSNGIGDIFYTWTVNDSRDFPIEFSDNASATAGETTATFSGAGTYLFQVTARNEINQTATSSVEVVVLAVPSALAVDPIEAEVVAGGVLQLSATLFDQFAQPISPPPVLAWAVDPVAGAIDAEGLFTAGVVPGGPFEVLVSVSDGLSALARVFILAPPLSWWDEFFSEGERNDPAIAGDLADPDGDGISNLLEYALGGNPRIPGTAVLPGIEVIELDGVRQPLLRFRRPLDRNDLTYVVEGSDDLLSWSAVSEDTWTRIAEEDWEWIEVRETAPAGTRFLRLRVTRVLPE